MWNAWSIGVRRGMFLGRIRAYSRLNVGFAVWSQQFVWFRVWRTPSSCRCETQLYELTILVFGQQGVRGS